jgi:hypothetical protein
MLKFLCPVDGISNGSSVEIQIPDECCGVKTRLQPTKHVVHGANIFYEKCDDHLRTYAMIWDNFGPNGKMNERVFQGVANYNKWLFMHILRNV